MAATVYECLNCHTTQVAHPVKGGKPSKCIKCGVGSAWLKSLSDGVLFDLD